MLSGLKIRSKDHAAWIIQATAVVMKEVVFLKLTAIKTGFHDARIRSRKNEGTHCATFELECQFRTRFVTTKKLIG